jgi:hypothetical protein
MDINTLLLALAVLWAVTLFGGFLFGKEQDKRRIPLFNRMLASLIISLAAWLWHFSKPNGMSVCFAIGMSFGMLGDLFMAKLILKNQFYIVGGIGAFGIGHLFYIGGIAIGLNAQAFSASGWFVLSIGTALMIASLLWERIVYVGAQEQQKALSTLHYGALGYSLLLASTAGIAWGAWLDKSQWGFIAVGATLFLISDMILALELFKGVRGRWIGDFVWLTYSPGQMLIVYGMVLGAIQLTPY